MELSGPSHLHLPQDPDEMDHYFMHFALGEALEAFHRHEVPVGAVLVQDNEILARAGNRCEELKDPTAHAEILAITQACETLSVGRLSNAVLYCTLEPCFMCAGALSHARIKRLVFGARDPKFGAIASLATLASDSRLNHRYPLREGVMADEARSLMKEFFHARR